MSDIAIRPIAGDDTSFVLDTWTAAHRKAPEYCLMPWAMYERLVLPMIRGLMVREDVHILGAYDDERMSADGRHQPMVGWIAWTPGSIPAVHFAYVRGPLRKTGLFTRLLKASEVGDRWLYTMRGSLPKVGRRKPSMDRKVAEALGRRGIAAVFVDLSEWVERMS